MLSLDDTLLIAGVVLLIVLSLLAMTCLGIQSGLGGGIISYTLSASGSLVHAFAIVLRKSTK